MQTAIKGVGKKVKEGGPKLVRRSSRIPFLKVMLRAEVWGPFPDCVQIGQDATPNCPAGLTGTGLFAWAIGGSSGESSCFQPRRLR